MERDTREGAGRAAAAPLWRRIADMLAEEVEAGRYRPEEPMPTVMAFAERFGVNRHTVRQALADLQARGLVSLERGRGTFVVQRNIDYRIGRRVRFSGNLAGTGLSLHRALIAAEKTVLDEAGAAVLGLPSGAPAWMLRTHSFAGRHPFALATSLVSRERFPDFPARLEACEGSMSAAFEAYGHGDYMRLSTRVEARMPAAREARLLALPSGMPILLARGLDGTPRGEPLHTIETAFASHRMRLLIEPDALLAGELD